ncbi:caveolin-3 [Biomphalaria pfeifferi]|uniref:Caveolin n=1 Tax=Biomphalaria pfeifferi TaxID=112525 RepID=A0AAD8C2D1_BIOPF|nr:caveolin-3 [Biomphalaria pfeifferi]
MSAKAETEIRLQVGEDDLEDDENKSKDESIETLGRDPLRINDSVKIAFEELFAEPHSTLYSFDSVWLLSFKIFNLTKEWCYKITTVLFAIPLAFLWGLQFGCMACCTIWCCRPWVKACQMNVVCLQGFLQILLDCLYKPVFGAIGHIFYNIRVKFSRNAV